MPEHQIIEADWTWTGEKFEPGIRIAVSPQGRIEDTGRIAAQPTRRLSGKALIPGMVNAHSHAFQRGLRGLGEDFPRGAGSFWSWRQEMYRLVSSISAEEIYRLSLQAFREMLAAGITTVGEFHYLHHDSTCDGYALDEVVLKAAHESGIRIVLIEVFYRTGAIGSPLNESQQRFRTPSTDDFWRQVDRLSRRSSPDTERLGVAVHSIRAAPREDLVDVHREAGRRELIFHMHVEEQRQEIEQCLEAYGRTPTELLCGLLEIDESFTAVHCTHTRPPDLERLGGEGSHICICPTTEANLGDGFADISRMPPRAVCLGSDSNSRICLFEEMRWLEYGQRLRKEQRGVFMDSTGSVSRALLAAATRNGARALGLKTGAIRSGFWADLTVLDLDSTTLESVRGANLPESLTFGSGREIVSAACVGGRWIA